MIRTNHLMENINITKLADVLSIQSHSKDESRMVEFLVDKILNYIEGRNDIFIEYDDEGNIYITKGLSENYPTVVSHIDTVHEINTNMDVLQIYQRANSGNGEFYASNEKNENTGIGGDDKVGVYACLEMLEKFDVIKIAFFSREEIGCIGSSKCNMSFFSDSAFVAQCDRKGNKDFIKYGNGVQLFGREFEDAIAPHLIKWGYTIEAGGNTDTVALKSNGLDVACFNMSCGYYEPHTANEYVVLDDVSKCIGVLQDIIAGCSNKKWTHKKSERDKPKSHYNYSIKDFDDYYNGLPEKTITYGRGNHQGKTYVTTEENGIRVKKVYDEEGIIISTEMESIKNNNHKFKKKSLDGNQLSIFQHKKKNGPPQFLETWDPDAYNGWFDFGGNYKQNLN